MNLDVKTEFLSIMVSVLLSVLQRELQKNSESSVTVKYKVKTYKYQKL